MAFNFEVMLSHIVTDTGLTRLGFKPGLASMKKLQISSQIRIGLHPVLRSMMKLLVSSQTTDLLVVSICSKSG
jgi:hypothetical protein